MQTTLPNLFNYATSELSFDAFVCWLASWSAPECQAADPSLHKLACDFLASLLIEHDRTLDDKIHSINIKRQYHNIDVLLIINDQFAVIIENKIRTKNHGDQLRRYKEEVSKRFPNLIRVPIYLKIYDQSNYEEIKKNGFAPYGRQDLLNLFSGARQIKNQIFLDFYCYLSAIERRVQSFETLLPEQWQADQWTGFFICLQAELATGNWGYIANPSGGFLGFWWNFITTPDLSAYLQIQHQGALAKVVIKISNKDSNKDKAVRTRCYEYFRQKFAGSQPAFCKPARFGKGETMTVLETTSEFRVFKNGQLDFVRTLQVIRAIEQLFQTTLKQDLENLAALAL